VYLTATTLAQAQPAEPGTAPLPVGHGELVLFADDEGSVLELAKSALENYGYRLVTASNGLEAVGCFELHQHEVKLVIMGHRYAVSGRPERLAPDSGGGPAHSLVAG